jgi:glycosyltransferase involved in cell wall biosynthesis
MRVGQNPAKNIDYVKKPENITVAIITYIPFLSGFYEESLEILKICLNSLLDNTKLPFDLMVFDNASCREVKDYLVEMQTLGKIQYLTLSDTNIGKGGGWNFIFNAAPGEYIAYADADIQFSENWLTESKKILDTYPKVGMVTGRPLNSPSKYFTAVTEWIDSNKEVEVQKGQLIDWNTYLEHTSSIGATTEQSREWYSSGEDILLTFKKLSAYAGSAHFQFTGKKEIFKMILPFNMDRPMGQVRRLDIKLNENGYLRLCTKNSYVKHLGNSLNSVNTVINNQTSGSVRIFWDNFLVRKILLYFYNRIFKIYFKNDQ